jgi:hypothetical protein
LIKEELGIVKSRKLFSSYSIVINSYSLSLSWQAGQLSSLQAKEIWNLDFEI